MLLPKDWDWNDTVSKKLVGAGHFRGGTTARRGPWRPGATIGPVSLDSQSGGGTHRAARASAARRDSRRPSPSPAPAMLAPIAASTLNTVLTAACTCHIYYSRRCNSTNTDY
jgi:hypothetical protein